MTFTEKTVEAIHKYLLAIMFGLPPLLGVIVWKSIDQTAWGRISDKVSKPALWATLGILVWLLLLLSAYILQLRHRLRVKLIPMFGAKWSIKDHIPYCPACETLLTNYRIYDVKGGTKKASFHCMTCKADVWLRDDEGKNLNLQQARAELSKLVAYPR